MFSRKYFLQRPNADFLITRDWTLTPYTGCGQSPSSSENANVIKEIEETGELCVTTSSWRLLMDCYQNEFFSTQRDLSRLMLMITPLPHHPYQISYCLPHALDFTHLMLLQAVLWAQILFSPSYIASPSREGTLKRLGISSFSAAGEPGFGSAGDGTILG